MKKSLSLVAVAALGMSGVWAQDAVAETPVAAQTQAAPTTADLQAALNAVEAGKPLGKALASAGLTARSAAADGTTLLMLAGEQLLDKPLFALLLAGANVNATDAEGRTALTRTLQQPKSTEYELRERMESCVNKLLVAGARTDAALHTELLLRHDLSEALGMMLSMKRLGMNDTDAAGRTLLMRALEQSARETALMLLSRKQVDCSLRDAEGRMALHYAMAAQSDGVWGYFFSFSHTERLMGPDAEWVNAQDAAGRTPLLVLVEKLAQAGKEHDDDTEKAVRQLIRSGADATLADAAGRSPLSVAKEAKLEQLCRYMTAIASPEQRQWETCAACLRAGDAEGLKRLLEGGADVAAKNADGCTLLQYLLIAGMDEDYAWNLDFELERSCRIKFEALRPESNLQLSAESLQSCLEVLLAAGADVNAAGDTLPTPVMLALGCKDAAVLRRLIEAGADVNACPPSCGFTALALFGNCLSYFAYNQPQWAEMMQLLLDAGADVNAKGETSGSVPLVALTRGARAGSGAESAVLLMLEKMLEKQPTQETLNNAFWACYRCSPAVLKRLVEAGCDINARSESGRSLLHYCAEYENPQNVRWLLAHGADVNMRDNEGETPWHVTLSLVGGSEAEAVLHALVQGGADVLAVNDKGETGLDLVSDESLYDGAASKACAEYVRKVTAEAREAAGLPAEESLFELTARGANKTLLRRLAAGGVDVNARDEQGRTPLMLAVCSGGSEPLKEDTEICKNCGRAHGSDRAHRRADMAAMLLAAGADADATDAAGKTAADMAAASGEQPGSDVLKYLNAPAARTDAAVNAQLTECMVCLCKGDMEGWQQKLQGVQVNAPLRNGTSLLEVALRMAACDEDGDYEYGLHDIPALTFLRKRDKEKNAAAIRSNGIAALRSLLAAGADPNARDIDGDLVVGLVLEDLPIEALSLLSEAGLDPHLTDADGTPLIVSAYGNKPVLEQLLAQSPTPSELTELLVEGLLRYDEENIPLAERLLAMGADVNGMTVDGKTPLTAAARRGHEKAVAFLLEHGADAAMPDKEGKTPADWAREELEEETRESERGIVRDILNRAALERILHLLGAE